MMEHISAKPVTPRLRLPPSPAGLPFIGHFHLLAGKPPHVSLQHLSKEHGPLMHLRLGSVPLIVASSPDMAKEVLKTEDAAFAYRPANKAISIMLQEKAMSFSPYGDYWKTLRKLCAAQLFSSKKVSSSTHIIRDELWELSCNLVEASKEREVVTMRGHLHALSFNVMTRILLEKRYFGSTGSDDPEFADEARRFVGVINDMGALGSFFCLSDYFPYLSWLDWTAPRFKLIAAKIDAFFDRVLNTERSDELSEFTRSARHYIGNDNAKMKALLMDLIVGGSETTSTAIEWALAELLHHPQWLARAQQELQQVVGPTRMAEESDIPKLPVLNAVIQETFRLHPSLALLLPHASVEPHQLAGYDIPANAMLMVNVYAIGRDPQVWTDPLEFKPERFIGSNICVHGQNFELLPFGTGKRICPGLPLALKSVPLVIANLLHRFEWKFHGTPQDQPMDEGMGAVNSMAHTLKVRVAPRLEQSVYRSLKLQKH